MKIFKYPLKTAEIQEVIMPSNSTVLCVQMQNGDPTLWVMVDEFTKMITRTIGMAGTGHELNDIEGGKYIGTVQMSGGLLVWHFFDLGL